ncbi:MAG: acyl carrier protein [Alphaproteobacteria bacterium]
MTRNEVLHKVIEIVNEHRFKDAPEATENSRLAEDLGMDSLDIVETDIDIERRLDIHFVDDDYEKFKFGIASVKDFVDLACKKLNIPTNGVQKNVEKTVIKPVQPQNPELKKLEQVDFARLPKSPIELNGYKIIVEKIAETKQNKR